MASFAAPDLPVLGYHKIRGLAAPLRMMFYYKKASFINTAYGADMKETWFGADKPQLLENNSCMNLPYVVDGPIVVTQSNSCAVYLQTNSCDCGVYTLRYLEEFLSRAVGAPPSVAVTEAAVDDKFAADDFASWFTAADVAAMRGELKAAAEQLTEEAAAAA